MNSNSQLHYQENDFTLLRKSNRDPLFLICMGRELKSLTPIKKKEDLVDSSLILGTISNEPWFLVLAECKLKLK